MLRAIRRQLAGWIDPPIEHRSDPIVDQFTALQWSNVGPRTVSGVPVNERTALGITALWRAVNLIAGKVAALSLEVRRRDRRGGSTAVADYPVYGLLHDLANAKQSAFHFRQAILGHVLTRGEGFASIQWNARASYPVAFHLLDPRNVEVKVGPERVDYHLIAENRTLPGSDVIHLRGLSYDGIRGYSPVTIAREQLATTLAQQVYEGALFRNGAKKGGHVEVPGNPTDAQMKQLRQEYEAIHRGAENAGRVPFFRGGIKWVDDNFSPADAQMILARGFSVLEIARLYGVPPHMLGVEGTTVGNAEQQARQFFSDTIEPLLAGIEGELYLKLFSPQERNAGLFVRHDARNLLRGDTAAQTAADEADFGMGKKSINELRLDDGLNPLDDPAADFHWVPTNNLAPIEKWDGQPTQPGSNANGPDAQPEPDDTVDQPAADDA